jgi:PAS domain S-box-containing protein/putative nucleotidyltransferase with HDIG domain
VTKILIADDNTQNLFLLETVMESYGYEVIQARNGVEALALALKNPPDLILTDILMPKMDGFELCRRCKAHDLLNQIPLIFYTATYTDPKDEQFALSLGAERFVIKPQSPKVLVQIVKEVLANLLKGTQVSQSKSPGDETVVLQQYTEVLFRKLERKVLQLEDVIANQNRTENELRESEQKYRALVENINDVLYTLDNQGTITYVSPVVERLSQYKVSDLIGKPFAPLVYPDDLPALLESYTRLVSGQLEPWEFRLVDKDGRIIFVRTSSRPIYSNGEIVGITALMTDITDRKQAEEDLIISYQKTKKTLNDAINTMAKIVEIRDPYTAGHQQKVAALSTAIATEMKLDTVQIEQIHMAATIHDIGKMNVPADILSRPGRLSTLELNLIKTHAQGGYEIVRNMDFPVSVAQSVLQHHERLDGSGYPNGLKGESISQGARVIAVADVVEAMSSHRPYRTALGTDKALEEISTNKGKLYDDDVVDACLKLFKEKDFKFEE